MVDIKENTFLKYPNIISYECTKKIKEQMEKNICKINIGLQGTGFFCKISFPDINNMLPVFITNNHVINDKLLYKKDQKINIDIFDESGIKEISLNNRMKYTNEEYDITIIEIKEKDGIKNFLELDEIIINDIINNDNKNKTYVKETVYIIQYPENKLSVSYGILDNIQSDKIYNFQHKCGTKGGSSGSPVLNLNNKIIGIHKEGNYNNSKLYNKGLFLNYPIKEFIRKEKLLKILNEKFKLNIKDNRINKLELTDTNLNGVLNELIKVDFEELKELNLKLFNNNLIDIKVLEKVKFEKLKLLFSISGLNILEKLNLKELKNLSYGPNNIPNINALEKVKFEKLEILELDKNKISNINVFEKVNFKELKELYLYNNDISDINVFKNVKFKNLEILDLGENKISDINILEEVNFKELKKLYLFYNNISDIKVFEKVNFKELRKLDLGENKISDINAFKNANLTELRELYLNKNNISEIKVFQKAKFEKLKKLDLGENLISDINILKNNNLKELKELYLNGNKISDIKVFAEVKFKKLKKLDLSENEIPDNNTFKKVKQLYKILNSEESEL